MTTWPVEELFVAPPGEATAFGRRFAEAASRHAVVVDPAIGLPVLLRRKDHARIFRDPETFSTRMFAGTVLDGALAALQGTLVGRLRERGEVDLIDDFAMALPRLILAELLEIPVEDIIRYDDHVRTILAGVVRIGDPDAQATAHAAHAELLELISAIVDHTLPTSPSLLGEIVGALQGASNDDVREPAEQVVLSLLLGGFETTSWMLARVAVETLLTLAPDLRPADDFAPTFAYGVRGSPAHGPDRLPAILT